MTLAVNAIQKAIFARLSTQSVPVYDFVPQDAALPYIVIGADTSIAWDTKAGEGQEFTCTVHCWDALKAGRKSVKATMEAIYGLLHRQEDAITVAGYSLVEIACEYTESFQETGYPGGTDHYYHGVLRFRALVHDD